MVTSHVYPRAHNYLRLPVYTTQVPGATGDDDIERSDEVDWRVVGARRGRLQHWITTRVVGAQGALSDARVCLFF